MIKLGENFESCHWPRRSGPGRWCIVQSEHRREGTAEAEIRKAGYVVYVPRYRTRMREPRNHRRWIDAVRPLFPGYLFVDVADETIPAGWLSKVRGVRDLVRQGEDPVRVPDVVIERLRLDQGDNYGQPYRAAGPAVPFGVGERVRLVGGPFTGFYGAIGSIDPEARLTAFIEAFGRVVPLHNLTVDQVERA